MLLWAPWTTAPTRAPAALAVLPSPCPFPTSLRLSRLTRRQLTAPGPTHLLLLLVLTARLIPRRTRSPLTRTVTAGPPSRNTILLRRLLTLMPPLIVTPVTGVSTPLPTQLVPLSSRSLNCDSVLCFKYVLVDALERLRLVARDACCTSSLRLCSTSFSLNNHLHGAPSPMNEHNLTLILLRTASETRLRFAFPGLALLPFSFVLPHTFGHVSTRYVDLVIMHSLRFLLLQPEPRTRFH